MRHVHISLHAVVVSVLLIHDKMSCFEVSFEPAYCAISDVLFVHAGAQDMAIVMEVFGRQRFVALYCWGDEWELVDVYEMGCQEVYANDTHLFCDNVVDVGQSVSRGDGVILVVE